MKLPKFNFTTSDYICFGIIGLCGIGLVKNEVTYRQHERIADAIHRHNVDSLNTYVDEATKKAKNATTLEELTESLDLFLAGVDDYISYDDSMEGYFTTFFKFWDWGCKHIVDEDVYEEIEPYLRSYKEIVKEQKKKKKSRD